MSTKHQTLDLSELVDSEKELSRWAWLRKKLKNPDDYVSIRHGFTHLAYAHTRHSGPAQALLCELTGLQPEDIHTQSIRTEQKSTGVKIGIIQKDLQCICCEEQVKK